MEWILLASALVAVGFSALLGLFFIKGTFNFLTKRTKGNAERFSSQSKPIYGGILFYSVFLLCALIYFFSPLYTPDEANNFIALMIIVSISFFMGLADDLLNTPPLFKFIVQFVCAFVLIKTGIVITISPMPWVNNIITVLWVVGIMNSFNMLDNMELRTIY
jgi:UDP-GlcNAc:undecaprenyl-phosphate GlcNAc-1-phosphate transferase